MQTNGPLTSKSNKTKAAKLGSEKQVYIAHNPAENCWRIYATYKLISERQTIYNWKDGIFFSNPYIPQHCLTQDQSF